MFKNRQEAAKLLAQKLKHLKGGNLLVLAIPRGGVVVGKILTQVLACPLDVMVVKKLGAPGNPELAIGAVGPDGVSIIDRELVSRTGADEEYLKTQSFKLQAEVRQRQQSLRGDKTLRVKGKTVVLTDDGIATGATVETAIAWIKTQKPAKIILAVPVAPPEVTQKFKSLVDETVFLETPAFFGAVGQFYQEFPQVTDEEVIKILAFGQNQF